MQIYIYIYHAHAILQLCFKVQVELCNYKLFTKRESLSLWFAFIYLQVQAIWRFNNSSASGSG